MGRRDGGLANFERFLDAWSRRDFLRAMGGAAALAAFGAGGLELLEACGAGGGGGSETPVKGGHLVEGLLADPSTFNPIYVTATTSAVATYTLFSKLLDSSADGALVPSIARAVPRPSGDQLSYRVELRQDVSWS